MRSRRIRFFVRDFFFIVGFRLDRLQILLEPNPSSPRIRHPLQSRLRRSSSSGASSSESSLNASAPRLSSSNSRAVSSALPFPFPFRNRTTRRLALLLNRFAPLAARTWPRLLSGDSGSTLRLSSAMPRNRLSGQQAAAIPGDAALDQRGRLWRCNSGAAEQPILAPPEASRPPACRRTSKAIHRAAQWSAGA